SRRRHTIFSRDWSSDVCSSDLIQFTSDMLPADIIGFSTFDSQKNQFSFHPGPIFTQVLLADEINRTTPKTQSALLEAMEERQVKIGRASCREREESKRGDNA